MSVSKPLRTIQEAVNKTALRPGPDVIQILGGVYHENITIVDLDSVTLSGSDDVEIVAQDTAKEVIYVKKGDVTLAHLRVSEGRHGIRGAGSPEAPIRLTLKHVESVDNVERGLRAVDVLDVSIFDCQFLGNGTDGIKAQTDKLNRLDTSFTVRNTRVAGSGDDGLDLESLGDIRLHNVIVQDTQGDDGLSIDDSASVFIEGSAFVNSHADGIDIDDTQAIGIVSTVSVGNGDGGLQIKAEEDFDTDSVKIIGSDFLENGADGIWITEENAWIQSVSLSSVLATGNGDSGLDIVVSGTLKLSAVTSENNGEPDVP